MNADIEKTEELLEEHSVLVKKKKSKKNISKKGKILIGMIMVIVLLISVFIIYPFFQKYSLTKNLELGTKYLAEGNYEEAVLVYQKAVNIDQKNTSAYVGMANAFTEKQEFGKAEESLRSGINAIENKEDKVILYENLVQVYKDIPKTEEEIKNLNNEAFDATSDRKFGGEQEVRVSRYLENLMNFGGFFVSMPEFNTADEIDKNWLFSRVKPDQSQEEYKSLTNYQKTNYQKFDGYNPAGKIESFEKNAKRTINPEIILPRDYDYKYFMMSGNLAKYDRETGVVHFRGIGLHNEGVFDDFYVTSFTKADGKYIIEGSLLKLEVDPEYETTNYDGYTCAVYDVETNNKVGTAVRHATAEKKLDGFYDNFDNRATYEYNFTDKNIKVFRYVVTDNPDGSSANGKGNWGDSNGPFHIWSRTGTDQTLADIL